MPNDQQPKDNQQTPVPSRPTEYQRVNFGDWRHNGSYAHLVTDIYREQATRIIQRAVRAKRLKENKPASSFSKDPVVKNDKSQMSILLEPINDDYKELVKKIESGAYDQLVTTNTDDAFRNLYKALRLDEITLNQFYLAYSIVEASEWYYLYGNDQAPTVHRIAFGSDQDNYDIPLLLYATVEQRNNFHNSLANEDRHYFTIDFPKSAEHAFFYHLLKGFFRELHHNGEQSSGSAAHTISLLKKYIDQFPPKEKTFFNEKLISLRNGDYDTRNSLSDFIAKKTLPHLINRDENNPDIQADSLLMILASLIEFDFFNSGIIASPSYNENNPESSVLAIMLTTLNAKNRVLADVFGINALELTPTTSKVTTRMIRADLEREKLTHDRKNAFPYTQALFSMYGHRYHEPTCPTRPIEMSHPDLINNNPTHKLTLSNLSRRLHDEGHTIQASASNSRYFKYIINLLSHIDDRPDIIMSPSIWKISDMIMFLPRRLREAINHKDVKLFQIQRFHLFIETLNKLFDNYQLSLYYHFLRDMVANKAYWDDMVLNLAAGFDGVAHNFLGMINEGLISEEECRTKKIATQLKNDLENSALITEIKNNPDISTKSLIICIKLKKSFKMSPEINNYVKYLKWQSNFLVFQQGLACFIIKNTNIIKDTIDVCLPSKDTLESIFSQLQKYYEESTITKIYMDLFNRKNLTQAPFADYASKLKIFNETETDNKDEDTEILQEIYAALSESNGDIRTNLLKRVEDCLLILSQLFHFRTILLGQNKLDTEEKKLWIDEMQKNTKKVNYASPFYSIQEKYFNEKVNHVVQSILNKLEPEVSDTLSHNSPRMG